MLTLFRRFWSAITATPSYTNLPSKMIIPRKKHTLSRSKISENALKVLYRLHKNGYQAYLVGGGVRDILLGLTPKDFDICTDAKPEEIRRLFKNCRIIGRRFKLAHVCFGYDIIEVATFRSGHEAAQDSIDAQSSNEGMILRDNVYGTLEDDVWRRDFTVNALYYNIADFSIVDYTGAMKDLAAKRLRMIGDPTKRFREDPVRIVRAIRFSAKLGLQLDADLQRAIRANKELLRDVSPARLFEEILKLYQGGAALKTHRCLEQYNIIPILFPALDAYRDKKVTDFIEQVLISTDERISSHKSVNPAFLFAGIFWPVFEAELNTLMNDIKIPLYQAYSQVADEILREQSRSCGLTRRYGQMVFEIWMYQLRLSNLQPRRVERLLEESMFRASYDFLGIRAKVTPTPELKQLFDWWTRYQLADSAQKTQLFKQGRDLSGGAKPKAKRRRKPRSAEA